MKLAVFDLHSDAAQSFLEIVAFRDAATQTCGCHQNTSQTCSVCQSGTLSTADGHEEALPSALLQLRTASKTVAGLVVLGVMHVGGQLVKGSAHIVTNASIGLTFGGIRGAFAGAISGVFWTTLSLLELGVRGGIVATAAVSSFAYGLWTHADTEHQPDRDCAEESKTHRDVKEMCDAAVNTEVLLEHSSKHGIPHSIALASSLQRNDLDLRASIKADEPLHHLMHDEDHETTRLSDRLSQETETETEPHFYPVLPSAPPMHLSLPVHYRRMEPAP